MKQNTFTQLRQEAHKVRESMWTNLNRAEAFLNWFDSDESTENLKTTLEQVYKYQRINTNLALDFLELYDQKSYLLCSVELNAIQPLIDDTRQNISYVFLDFNKKLEERVKKWNMTAYEEWLRILGK